MHSDCRIPGLQSPSRVNRDTGELDTTPAWKLRKIHRVQGNRLSLRLADLDKKRDEITSRITHSMKQLNKELKVIPRKRSPVQSPRVRNAFLSSSPRSPQPNTETKGGTDCFGSGVHTSTIENGRRKKSSLHGGHCNQISNKHHSSPCFFGTTNQKTSCFHFPCIQPNTYHSLGFRLDDSSTEKWMTWSELRDAKLGHRNTYQNLNLKLDPKSGLIQWCTLARDFQSRKERLLKEISRIRRSNECKKPPSWATNYGKITPYKTLTYPVRLHPLEMDYTMQF